MDRLLKKFYTKIKISALPQNLIVYDIKVNFPRKIPTAIYVVYLPGNCMTSYKLQNMIRAVYQSAETLCNIEYIIRDKLQTPQSTGFLVP